MDDMFDLDLALSMPEACSSTGETTNPEAPDSESKVAAAEDLVAEMPTVAVAADGGRCTVCMEGFEIDGGHGKQIPCGHVFHENCIALWISVHDSCPLCRSRVSSDSIAASKLLL